MLRFHLKYTQSEGGVNRRMRKQENSADTDSGIRDNRRKAAEQRTGTLTLPDSLPIRALLP